MTRVKVCGITNLEDAHCAVLYGASALGFVFYPGSKRYIEPEKAGEIISSIPPFIASVGVFVNQDIDHITRVQETAKFQVCQLHGDETPEFCSQVPFITITALRVGDKLEEQDVDAYPVDAILLDKYSADAYGGTGTSFDWEAARGIQIAKPVIISGGLAPENVAQAIRALKPFAVDVSTGVEDYPGKKNSGKIKKFIEAVINEN